MANFVENFRGKSVGVAIRELRDCQEKTLIEVAEPCGASQSWLSRLEREHFGRTSAKGTKKLICIFEQLGSSYDDYAFSQHALDTEAGSSKYTETIFDTNQLVRQLSTDVLTLGEDLMKIEGLINRLAGILEPAKAFEVLHPDNV